MICPKCGENIVEGSNACPKCGYSANDVPQFIANGPETNSNSEPTMNTQPAPATNVQPAPTTNVQPAPTTNVPPEPTTNVQPTPTTNAQPEPVITPQDSITNSTTTSDEPQIVSTQPPVENNPVVNETIQNPTVQQPEMTSSNQPQKKKGKKAILGIIILVSLVVFIGIVVLIAKNFGGKTSNDKTNTIFQMDSLIKIKKEGKYGFIDSKGKEKIKPQYDTASGFYGDYAVVSFKTKEDNIEEEQYAVIDKNGNVKITANSATQIKYNAVHNVWIIKDQLYNSSLKKISPDNISVDYAEEGYFRWYDDNKKTGIMNASGKITYTYNLKEKEHIMILDVPSVDSVFKQKYCIPIIDAEKYAVVNCDTGKVIYDYTNALIVGENNNIFHVSDLETYKQKEQFYVQNDEIVYQTTDNNISLSYSNGNITIRDDSKSYDKMYSYIDVATGKKTDKETKIEIDEEWEKLMDVKEFSCGTGVGLMRGNKVIIPCEWTQFSQFDLSLYTFLKSNGKQYMIAEKDDKSYLLNIKNGKTEAEFNSTNVYDSTGSTFIHYTDNDTKKMVIFNLITKKSISVDEKTDYSGYANYMTLKENNKLNYYNMNMELIYTES